MARNRSVGKPTCPSPNRETRNLPPGAPDTQGAFDPAAVSGDVPGRFGLYISILSRTARSYFQKELAAFGIGPGQQAYLLALFPGETVAQDVLVRRLSVDKANVTRAVKALEQAGLMEQGSDPADGRIRLIRLTGSGRRVRESVERISARWLDLLAEDIPEDEWIRLEETLGRVAVNAWNSTGKAS